MIRTILFTLLWIASTLCAAAQNADNPATEIKVGAERTDRYLPQLRGLRVAVLANHTAMAAGRHIVDMF